MNVIIDLNESAIGYINSQQHDEALVYLSEAERILEYGASCGKSIDRNLIICVLHNESCSHYREGDLNKASSYI